MSVKQFETFLVEQFLANAETHIEAGFRYQFKSPDSENSLRLYQAMIAHSAQSIVATNGIELPYIELARCKVVPVIHSEDPAEYQGFTDNYISHLRDEVASQSGYLKGCALVVIHNSLLDTLINSAEDLAQSGQVWSPTKIKEAMKGLIDQQDKGKDVSNCLLDDQFGAILEDGATMFGFESLYKAVEDGDLRFNELGMFEDPLILNLSGNEKQVKQRLANNRALFYRINFEMKQYGELQSEAKLFGDKFIKIHFSELADWKEVEYQTYLDEIKRNAQQQLVLEEEQAGASMTITGRNRSETKAGLRDRHLIIELDEGVDEFELKLVFVGAPDLKKDEFHIVPKKALNYEEVIKVDPTRLGANAKLKGKYKHEPLFFNLALKRENKSEVYNFRCLVVRKGEFYIEPFKNIFLVEHSKQRLTLNMEENKLPIRTEEGATCSLTDAKQVVNIAEHALVDFEALANEADEIDFSVKSGDNQLSFNVEGAVATDSLSLPLLLNRGRYHKLFKDDYNGELYSQKGKVGIDNSEFVVPGLRLKLLRWEEEFINRKVVAIFNDNVIKLDDLLAVDDAIHAGYIELYDYLEQRRSTPSLASWGDQFTALVENVVDACLAYFDAIPTGSMLTSGQKAALQIGLIKSEEEEYYSPFHPLMLAYYLNLRKAIREDASFVSLPDVTFERLSPKGLLPYVYHPKHEFAYNQQVKENAFWLKSVPQEKSSLSFVRKLVKEKIDEFQTAFSQLFTGSEKSIIVNAVNQDSADELFMGLVDYIRNNQEQSASIHVNLYDEKLTFNAFDRFAETANYDELKEWLELNKGKVREVADTIIDILRTRLTYSKFTNEQAEKNGQAYAHLSFFRNNEKVDCSDIAIELMESGIACDGLLPGEASHSDNGSYFTGFGLKNTDYQTFPHLMMAKHIGSLMKPALQANRKTGDTNAIALAVSEDFKDLLERSYDSSIWTIIIDPKVTLDFFHSNEDVVLIHYSDQYTSSSSYDAITVTAQRDLFEKVIKQDDGGQINEFNAFNGDWLLKMMTCAPTINKERKGVIGAYKFVTSLVHSSDITWVPLSVAEMIRVSGNIGLKMSDSEFSRNVQGYKKGAISDDVLLVGFKDQQMYLLPVEVKTGSIPDYKKAVKQAKELLRYLSEDLLGNVTLASKLYRGLFMRQVLMQVDKYRLYNVFASNYFDSLLANKEELLKGDYSLAKVAEYPDGFVVSHLEGASCLEPDYQLLDGILKVDLPMGLLPSLVETPLQDVLNKLDVVKLCHVPEQYILGGSTQAEVAFSSDNEDISGIGNLSPNLHGEELQPDVFNRVEIGSNTCTGEKVYWEYGHKDLANRHMIIFGSSGQGKTYCIQGLMMSMADSQIRSLVVDYTNGFLPNHLEPEFLSKLDPKSNVMCNEPFEMSPFRAQKQDFGGLIIQEKPHTVAGRIASVFNKVYSSIGEKQIAVLNDVIEYGVQKYGSAYSFQNMYDDLLEEETVGPTLASKLSPLVKSNLFSSNSGQSWESVFQSDRYGATIMQLASLSHDISMLCTEFLLWDLYSYACSYGSKNTPVPIVLDEVQNLDHRLESPLGKMLTEGRKFGVSLILATQTLSMLKRDEQDRLFQASHKLFFAPAKTETKTYAKILELSMPGTKQAEWEIRLGELSKGQCLSVGYHMDSTGNLKVGVKKVHITQMCDRI
ncbi:DNA phosphorothioation-dependent restriction protein DptH [Photobacterium proteolyticum]|uniref:DNA phosphorothioation-dependent restriction protein DptH n=1 Tax=Photobacterium proteolyticum TaxID=1903952 RepID=A0A1Q9GXQ4_9GAMM|nr:DNA phosphorothioation-dependent restriction protein DptH [Photobacterium proteolyticum]OLQ79850.1 DNA phosphorothioation-dependent restriction protein DptH [Photobacterium proteolyticum]